MNMSEDKDLPDEKSEFFGIIDRPAPYDVWYSDGRRRIRGYSVKVLDMRHYQDKEWESTVHGFETVEAATEYASRRMRASVEKARGDCTDAEAIRRHWFAWGEDCLVIFAYKGSEDLDFFLANPGSPEECDYRSIEPRISS